MSRDPLKASYVSGPAVPNSTAVTAVLPGPPQQSTTMAPAQTPTAQTFKPGTLYAVLLYRHHLSSWHWALYLPYESPPPPSTPCSDISLGGALDASSDRNPISTKSAAGAGVASSASWQGNVWHCTNDKPHGLWTYEELTPDAIGLPSRLVLAARLADLSSLGSPPEVATALTDLLRHVPVRAEAHKSVFNCRTWMLDGIGELDDGGFLSCMSTMALERELVAAAQLATPKHEEDGSYVMIIPRNCRDN